MKFLIVLALCGVALGATREPDITEAVRSCERDVPAFCISRTCPQFCNTFATRSSKASCAAGCTGTQRCAVKANVASQNIRGNEALDGQNREQLIRCIAQVRDPNFTHTGVTREDVRWRDYQTTSFRNAVQPRTRSHL